MLTVSTKQFQPERLTCGFIRDEKSLNAMFFKEAQSSIWQTWLHWWLQHRKDFFEDLTKSVEFLLDPERNNVSQYMSTV